MSARRGRLVSRFARASVGYFNQGEYFARAIAPEPALKPVTSHEVIRGGRAANQRARRFGNARCVARVK